jgi:hypothetical protein
MAIKRLLMNRIRSLEALPLLKPTKVFLFLYLCIVDKLKN